MVPPKYNFYAGKADSDITFISGVTITETGEFVASSGNYASSYSNVLKADAIFIDVKAEESFTKVFFFTSSETFISSTSVKDNYNKVISVPKNAKYCAIRCHNTDTGIVRKLDEPFIYTIKNINPHYKKLEKKYAKESGQEFFRISLEGKVTLFGNDYEIIKNANIEDNMIFLISKYNSTSKQWLLYYKGCFSKTDCKLDTSKKRCELKLNALDDYTDIMNGYENVYDIIKLAPKIEEVGVYKRSLMQIYIKGSNSITNLFGGTYWESDVNESIDSHDDLVNKYYFAYIKAGNEFYINDNTSIGGYMWPFAGTNGLWANKKGYTCKTTLVISKNEIVTGNIPTVYDLGSNTSREAKAQSLTDNTFKSLENLYKLQIFNDSSEDALYQSAVMYYVEDDNAKYIGRESVELERVSNSEQKLHLTSIFSYCIYKRLLCDVSHITDSEGQKETYELPYDDFATNSRNYKRCIGLKGGAFYCTTFTVDEPTKFGMNDFGEYFSDKFIPGSTGLTGRLLPISRNSWANASLWFVYDSTYKSYEQKLRWPYRLKNSYSIAEVIKVLLKKLNLSITHEATSEYSQFLYGASNPLGLAKFWVYVTPKSNILKGNYDQPAQKAEASLKNIMDMLKTCFRCYWFIEDGKLKIEHIKYFINGRSYSQVESYQLDFTSLTDQFNKKLTSYFQTELEFDKNDLTHRYEFDWMDNSTEAFGPVYVDVNSNYIQKDKTESINADKFSSDVDFMMFNPNSFSNDGFALLCPIKEGGKMELPIIESNDLIDENGNSYWLIAQNWYASWAYLSKYIYIYDMPAISLYNSEYGNMSASDVKRCMKQSLEFPSENDLDCFELIKTEIGKGMIMDMSFNLDTRNAKITLAYKAN